MNTEFTRQTFLFQPQFTGGKPNSRERIVFVPEKIDRTPVNVMVQARFAHAARFQR